MHPSAVRLKRMAPPRSPAKHATPACSLELPDLAGLRRSLGDRGALDRGSTPRVDRDRHRHRCHCCCRSWDAGRSHRPAPGLERRRRLLHPVRRTDHCRRIDQPGRRTTIGGALLAGATGLSVASANPGAPSDRVRPLCRCSGARRPLICERQRNQARLCRTNVTAARRGVASCVRLPVAAHGGRVRVLSRFAGALGRATVIGPVIVEIRLFMGRTRRP